MQLIDLYLPELRPQRDPLALGNVLAALGLVVLGLLVLTWVMHERAMRFEQQVAATEAEHAKAQAQFERLRGQWQRLRAQREADDREATLRAELLAKRHLLGQLAPGQGTLERGFSPLLVALSEGLVSGVWLSRLALSADGSEFSLHGHARTAEGIALFMAGLSQQPALQGHDFRRLELTRRSEPAEQAPRIDFWLARQTEMAETER